MLANFFFFISFLREKYAHVLEPTGSTKSSSTVDTSASTPSTSTEPEVPHGDQNFASYVVSFSILFCSLRENDPWLFLAYFCMYFLCVFL